MYWCETRREWWMRTPPDDGAFLFSFNLRDGLIEKQTVKWRCGCFVRLKKIIIICNRWCQMWGNQKGKCCVKKNVEDKSLKTSSHQFQFVVGTKYEPKGHEQCRFHTRDHQHAKRRIPDQTFYVARKTIGRGIRSYRSMCSFAPKTSSSPWSQSTVYQQDGPFVSRVDWKTKKKKKGVFIRGEQTQASGRWILHDVKNEESSVKISKYVKKNIFYPQYVQLCTVSYIWQNLRI